eukprot:8094465-Alexandrium_andersonii.AAC.1
MPHAGSRVSLPGNCWMFPTANVALYFARESCCRPAGAAAISGRHSKRAACGYKCSFKCSK